MAMPQSRSYPAPNLELKDLVNALTQFFGAQMMSVQNVPLADGAQLRAEHMSQSRKIVGMSSALTVTLRQVGDTLTVEIQQGDFVNQAVATGIWAAVFFPVAIAGLVGAAQQASLDDKTFMYIQQFLASQMATS